MTDTNQLPEPELGYIHTDKSNQPAFSARQMRDAMERATQPAHATQAEVTDEQIKEAAVKAVKDGKLSWLGFEKDDQDKYTLPVISKSHYQFARAILALRPQAVPMTDEAANAMIRETVRGNAIRRGGSTSLQIVRATEAYYGITSQAKKEKP